MKNNINVIKFDPELLKTNSIVFCLVDNINQYFDCWTKEIIKNISDYTISNLSSKGYIIYQGFNEDHLLNVAAENGHDHAVVFSTGTEFINGSAFFDCLNQLTSQDYFICGHVLDRGDAYYELHNQCYVINLKTYTNLKFPKIGQQCLGQKHDQIFPLRSDENYHDDYTPKWISLGTEIKNYNHQCHGWHIISISLKNNLPVLIFDNEFRSAKKHYYPESKKDFLQHIEFVYFRDSFCRQHFVHKQNYEWSNGFDQKIQQLIAPASGTLYFDLLDQENLCKVILYDYNLQSLEYWKNRVPKLKNVEYVFVEVDFLINSKKIFDYVDIMLEDRTLFNLSNVFCYEATAPLYSLNYRLYKENEIISDIKKFLPNSWINFSGRASTGFANSLLLDQSKNFKIFEINQLKKPTWHYNLDWN